jgi:hypothetical protein
MQLTKNAARCLRCGGYIESKFTHDYVTCPCGAISVDGGLDYRHYSWPEGDPENYLEDLSEYKESPVSGQGA